MDGRTDIALTPPYMRDHSIAAAAVNPSAGYTSAAATARLTAAQRAQAPPPRGHASVDAATPLSRRSGEWQVSRPMTARCSPPRVVARSVSPIPLLKGAAKRRGGCRGGWRWSLSDG